MASSSKVQPAANSTYELVQSFLLMGNQTFQMLPNNKPVIEAASRPPALLDRDFGRRSQMPASTPNKMVPTAGISLSSPSGSRTPSYRRPGRSLRSRYATQFRSGSSRGTPWVGTPKPGMGTQRMRIQYPNSATMAVVTATQALLFHKYRRLANRKQMAIRCNTP